MKSEADAVATPSFRMNFLWAGGGNAVYMVSQWGVLIVLAQLGSPAEVGRYAFGLALAGPIMLLAGLILDEVLATDTKSEFAFADYMSLRFISTVIGLAVVGSLTAALGLTGDRAVVVLLIAAAKGVDGIGEILHAAMRRAERMDLFARGLSANGIGTVIAVSVMTATTGAATGAALGSVIGSSFALAFITFPLGIRVLKGDNYRLAGILRLRAMREGLVAAWKPAIFKKLAWICLPLGVVTLLTSLSVNIPRYFIEHYLGEESLGIFSAITYIVLAVVALASTVGQSASPRLASYFRTGRLGDFRLLLLKVSLIGFSLSATLTVISVLLGKPILRVLYGKVYADNSDLLIWGAITSFIVVASGVMNYAALGIRRFTALAATHVIATVAMIVACFVLVPSQGLLGAVTAGAVGSVVRVLGCLIVVSKALRLRSAELVP